MTQDAAPYSTNRIRGPLLLSLTQSLTGTLGLLRGPARHIFDGGRLTIGTP